MSAILSFAQLVDHYMKTNNTVGHASKFTTQEDYIGYIYTAREILFLEFFYNKTRDKP